VFARISALVALVVVVLAGAFVVQRTLTAEPAEDAAKLFVKRWAAGDDAAAARATDAPKAAAAALRANRRGLDGAGLKAVLGEVEESDNAATATLSLRWDIPRIGRWGYRTRLSLRKADDEWRVRWSPKLVHPKLNRLTRLGTAAAPKPRGEILDRDRRPLMRERAVVRVGGVDVTVLNAHLDWDTGMRSAQLEAFLSWGQQFGGPRIAGGDFNSWWGEWWIGRIEAEYSDTWEYVTGSDENGHTLNGAVRFDYLFRAHDGNTRLIPTGCWVQSTSLSDHAAVIADYTVR